MCTRTAAAVVAAADKRSYKGYTCAKQTIRRAGEEKLVGKCETTEKDA